MLPNDTAVYEILSKKVSLPEEIWKPISGFPEYEVSNLGRIRSWRRVKPWRKNAPKIMVQNPSNGGYLMVFFHYHKQRWVKYPHRLVLEAFVGSCPEGQECNHKDGNKNNCHLDNLEWISPSENIRHALMNGLRIPGQGEKAPNSKLKEGEVWLIRKLAASGVMGVLISKIFKLSRGQVSRIVNHRNWAP